MNYFRQLLQALNSITSELKERNRIERLKNNIYEDSQTMKLPAGSQAAPSNLDPGEMTIIKFIPKGDRVQTDTPTVGHPFAKP